MLVFIITDGMENASVQYGRQQIKKLIEEKQKDKDRISMETMDVDHIRQLEELYQQINFLGKFKGDGGNVRL